MHLFRANANHAFELRSHQFMVLAKGKPEGVPSIGMYQLSMFPFLCIEFLQFDTDKEAFYN